MTDQQFAALLRRALPAYEKQMSDPAAPTAFMCHILEAMHERFEIDVFTLKEARKRIQEKIDNNATLFTYLNRTQGRADSLGEENRRALNFWYEWIKELEQPASLPKLPAPEVETIRTITNLDKIQEELYKLTPREQALALKAYLHELHPDDKRAFMHTKLFFSWCRDNTSIIEKLQEDGEM